MGAINKMLLAGVVCMVMGATANGQESDSLTQFPDSMAAESPEPVADTVASPDNMVITATRTRRTVAEIPVSVSVVPKEKIEAAPARNVTDILDNQPSVQIKRITAVGEGVPYEINIRGIPSALAATRTLILVDGIPTNASGTPFLILNQVPLEAIERVEIVRGPYSCLYGANAFGGVINIVTKNGLGPPQVLLRGELGNLAYWHGACWSGGSNDFASYSVSVGGSAIDNYMGRDSVLVTVSNLSDSYKPADNYDYRDQRLFGKGIINISDKGVLTVHGRFFNSDLGYGKTSGMGTYAYNEQVDLSIKGRQTLIGPECKLYLNGTTTAKIGGYYRTVIGEFYNEATVDPEGKLWSPTYWKSASHDWQIDALLISRLLDILELSIGGDALINSIDFGATVDRITGNTLSGFEAVDAGIRNYGGYIQGELRPVSPLIIIAGVRSDYHSEFGLAVSPKLSASYSFFSKALRVHGSGGRAFRAPTLAELYAYIPISGNFSVKPNPDLKPEYVWSGDAGIDYELAGGKLKTGVGGFYNKMNNLVVQGIKDAADIGKRPIKISHLNTSEAWSAGCESEISLHLDDRFVPSANYVYQKSRDEQAVENLGLVSSRWPSDYIGLDYIPEHILNLDMSSTVKLGKFVFQSNIAEGYMGQRSFAFLEGDTVEYAPGKWEHAVVPINTPDGKLVIVAKHMRMKPYWHTNLDFQCTYRQRYTLGIAVQNLFDTKWEESLGTYSTGRVVFVKAGVNF